MSSCREGVLPAKARVPESRSCWSHAAVEWAAVILTGPVVVVHRPRAENGWGRYQDEISESRGCRPRFQARERGSNRDELFALDPRSSPVRVRPLAPQKT